MKPTYRHDPRHVECLFSCHQCGIKDEPVNVVPPRQPNESESHFEQRAINEVGWKHVILAPMCESRHIQLKVPILNGRGPGFAPSKPCPVTQMEKLE